ncbi:MAG: UDP-N-acetylmuramate dehydrogenase [Candidatus Eremiobacteraeota bacterium]|nr:UDP-N-acetylmuramate dehydrogenase [Candidatus Eremiobacteraeota bacterium]
MSRDVALAPYTTYGIGGRADYFWEAPSLDSLKKGLHFAGDEGIPLFLLGGGSNVLFADEGIRGMVLRNAASGLVFRGSTVMADSGLPLECLLKEARALSLGGLEFLAGIPGTVGGALYGNAGAYGRSISETLVKATLIDAGGIEREVGPDYFEFRYRHSSLKHTREIILTATLELRERDSDSIGREMEAIMAERREKHPWHHGSCGCFFKNVATDDPGGRKLAAGKLLDSVGARGLARGRALVYEKHCNFLINAGGATARDILSLAALLKEKVREAHHITLEEEVQIIGERPPWERSI